MQVSCLHCGNPRLQQGPLAHCSSMKCGLRVCLAVCPAWAQNRSVSMAAGAAVVQAHQAMQVVSPAADAFFVPAGHDSQAPVEGLYS